MIQHLKQHSVASDWISYDDFLKWDGENQHVEWVDGKVIEMALVGDLQQDLKGFLLSVLRILVEASDQGIVRDDPFQMKTGSELPGRAPDIMLVAEANLARMHTNHLEGPADLVVEISGPGSRRVDQKEKFNEYQEGGVREYWLIDPERKAAKFYLRGRDGKFHLVPIGKDGIYRCGVIKGVWIRVEWLWQMPLPSVLSVLKEWGMVK